MFSDQPLSTQVQQACRLLQDGYSMMAQHFSQKHQPEYLEGVSKVRYSLSVVADVLSRSEHDDHQKLLEVAEKVCTDTDINVVNHFQHISVVGPSIYLVKLLIRRYGMPCLKATAEAYKWILPDDIRPKEVR